MAHLRLSCFYLLDVCIERSTALHNSGVLIMDKKSFNCHISFDCLGKNDDYKLQRVKAMPVFTTSGLGITGLLLEPTEKQRGQYQRVGWFWVSALHDREAFGSIMVKPSCHVAGEECLQIHKDKDGNSQRVIILV
jgi:hypothetical protein